MPPAFSMGSAAAQFMGALAMALGAFFALIALARVFEDLDLVREIVFRFKALGVESLWFIAILLFLAGYYVFRSD